jgi:dihydropyrimidinase
VSAYDLVVRGGQVVTETAVVPADVAVRQGVIAALLPRAAEVEAREVIDAEGRIVLPGVVDPHAHYEMGPGDERYGETRSAVVGGVTSTFTYLLSGRPYTEILPQELAKLRAEVRTDVGLHLGMMTDAQLAELDRYVDEYGIPSFKYFMNFRGNEGAYLGLGGNDDGFLLRVLEAIGRRPGCVMAVHTENIELVWTITARLKEEGREDLAVYSLSRPDYVESTAAHLAATLAEVTGAHIYVPHVSSRRTLDVLRAAKARGARVTVETCPHYLAATCYEPLGHLGKVNPPLRGPDDVDALWEGIADGSIDVVGSDHVPRRAEKKRTGSIWTASAGFPGTATILPVLWTEGVRRRGLSLVRLAQLVSTQPARTYGVYPRKGAIRVGADADLVVVDPDAVRPVRAAELGSFSDYSIFEGRELAGWPELTLLRGRVVGRDGRVLAQPGEGLYLAREAGR